MTSQTPETTTLILTQTATFTCALPPTLSICKRIRGYSLKAFNVDWTAGLMSRPCASA